MVWCKVNQNASSVFGFSLTMRGPIEPRHVAVAAEFASLQSVAMLKRRASNKEIAQVLGLAEGTVKVHLHSIRQSTGVCGRHELNLPRTTARSQPAMQGSEGISI
ncbi:hypothetical protein JQ641_18605 [Bradyrhizobium sp. JYMT SZCCT0180]|nr:hypothetical protein [Bradyrhizobium sp. JYMT SZCCT0180]